MITVAEAARRLGRSIEQVRRYLREGKLPGRRIGQQWFIEEQVVPHVEYEHAAPNYQFVREPAVMEKYTRTRDEIDALIREINEQREAIRRRLGGDIDIDVVEMLRVDRDEH
jgi:excisionase family DNA binding protein